MTEPRDVEGGGQVRGGAWRMILQAEEQPEQRCGSISLGLAAGD